MKKIKHFASAGIVVFFLAIAVGSGDDKKTSFTSVMSKEKLIVKKVGETLPTEYFDVTVNKVGVRDRVSTGNEFADLNKEEGVKYLIINVSFKNTSNESRMLMDGEILTNYNGKDYTFDKSEMLMEDGWGLLMDQVNPLVSKKTNLVYKIPSELKGVAYYKPGRSGSDQLIELGNIE